MITREEVIAGYMINDKHVIAEMLYDTITKYEANIKSLEAQLANTEQFAKHISCFTDEELMIELSSRGIDGDEFDHFADEYNNEWGE